MENYKLDTLGTSEVMWDCFVEIAPKMDLLFCIQDIRQMKDLFIVME
jgi:hypothetical protein